MNLEREMINAVVGRVYIDNPIEDYKRGFKQLEKKAKKEGFISLHLSIGYNEGDDNTLERNYIELCGSRVETEIEWHKRLEWKKILNIRELEHAQQVLSWEKTSIEENTAIDKALEKTSYRCEKCGVPETGLTHMGNWKRSKRLCGKCCNILREEN